MRGRWNDDAVAGAFEELPALLVILVAMALFAVSVAGAVSAWEERAERDRLQDDCQTFAGMVRSSDTLCIAGSSGVYDISRLRNLSAESFIAEFDPSALGLGYRVTISCVEPAAGNSSFTVNISTGDIPEGAGFASVHTCVTVQHDGRIGAARMAVTVWRLSP